MAVFVKDVPAGALESLVVTFGEVRAVTEATAPGSDPASAPTTTDGERPTDTADEVTTQDRRTSPTTDAQQDEDVSQEIPFENGTATPSPATVTPGATPDVDDEPVEMNAEAQTLFRFSAEVDLAGLDGPRDSELLGVGALDPGTYEHLVLEIQSAQASIVNETEKQELDITSEFLVVSADFDVREGETTQVLIDFDLNGSVTRETITHATTPPETGTGNVTDIPTGNESANETTWTWTFQPRVKSIWVAFTENGLAADEEGFAFDEGFEREAAVMTAASADVRDGILVLGNVTVLRMASVETNVALDVDGDGIPDQNVTGDLESEIERIRSEEPQLADDLLADGDGTTGGLTGGVTGDRTGRVGGGLVQP